MSVNNQPAEGGMGADGIVLFQLVRVRSFENYRDPGKVYEALKKAKLATYPAKIMSICMIPGGESLELTLEVRAHNDELHDQIRGVIRQVHPDAVIAFGPMPTE